MDKTGSVVSARNKAKKSLAAIHNRRLNKLLNELASLKNGDKDERPIHIIAAPMLSELEKVSWEETQALLNRILAKVD